MKSPPMQRAESTFMYAYRDKVYCFVWVFINEATQFRGSGISAELKARLFIQATMVIAPLFLSCVTNGRSAQHPYIRAEITSRNGTGSNGVRLLLFKGIKPPN